MGGERLIREESLNFSEICDFLGFRGIDLAEKKRDLSFTNFLNEL